MPRSKTGSAKREVGRLPVESHRGPAAGPCRVTPACTFVSGDPVVWLRVGKDGYGRVTPLLGRFEKAVAGQCVVRVYSVAHAEWLKRTVQASELDAAAAHEIARLVELERS